MYVCGCFSSTALNTSTMRMLLCACGGVSWVLLSKERTIGPKAHRSNQSLLLAHYWFKVYLKGVAGVV